MKFGGRCVSRPKPTKHWWKMKTARVRIIKHETVPGCGKDRSKSASQMVASIYIYWDGIPARRMRPETLDRDTALEKALWQGPQRAPRAK